MRRGEERAGFPWRAVFWSSLHFHSQVTKSNTNPEELCPLANQLTSDYGRLASQAKPAAWAAENEEVTRVAPTLTLPLTLPAIASVLPFVLPSSFLPLGLSFPKATSLSSAHWAWRNNHRQGACFVCCQPGFSPSTT